MMICCLNPDCLNPLNDKSSKVCASCGVPLIPLLRNRFRVIRVLSQQGGFGKTYLAQDSDKLNEPCVIKQLAPRIEGNWALKKAVELFEKEAQRLQELGENPQIPKLLAYFEQDSCLYLVQQFIDGENLLEELENRREGDNWLRCYSEKEVREFLLNLLPVLHFVHERGVVHRDIKPQNIIRRTSPKELAGNLVLIDFGSSKELKPKLQLKAGTSIGSHGYCAIEQIRDGLAYPASDLFSVGATCFHLMTGISPFQLWTEHGYGWMSNWEQYLNYPISDELARIINKLLKKDVEHRYKSAVEVIADLKELQKYPVVLPPLTETDELLLPPTEIFSVNRYTKLKKILLALAAISVFIVGEIWYWKTRETQIRNHTNNQPAAKTERILSQPLSNKQKLAVTDSFNLAYDSVSSLAISPDSKTVLANSVFGIKLWSLITGQEISVFDTHKAKVNVVAINPEATKFASGSDDKTIKIWNLATGQEIRTLKGHKQSVHALAISPDGKILASGGDDNIIKLWNLNTGENIVSFNSHNARISSLAFDSTGNILASGSFDGTIKLWDLKSYQFIRNLLISSNKIYSINFVKIPGITANDSLIGNHNNSISIWNPVTGDKIRTFAGHSQPITSTAIGFKNNLLASGSSDNTIKLWNLNTGELLNTLKGHSGKVESLAFNNHGNILVSSARDKTIKIWQISFF
ncbi:MAG: serine/threonine-protein kinase [Cyanobacteria bacterium J06633_8]